ncbi:rhodanese-like domain-containing protein [Hyphococcus sp.]|uniref:rhodanese-like domain-containing protein n=1 Tax=Hyphococcus sp. TaxID=2038636 RepID=UPI0035C77188
MFIEKIKTDGLSHLSYLVGAGGKAAVIDPRRDCDLYVEMAAARGCRITHVFETHRHEDIISGAPVLKEMTGAAVFHGPDTDGEVVYAETVREGDEFEFGSLLIKVLQTPGHTFDSVSYAVYDKDFGDKAVGVFTGDALFVGDVGRTDFYPDRAEEVAGLLHDSLQKILSLGDQAIVYPAHGAGSVCGDNMADREFSTLGYERKYNPMLQHENKQAFIEKKLNEYHDRPPYFRLMEKLNLEGAGPAKRILTPAPLDAETFLRRKEEASVVDVRGIADYLGAHVKGSFAIPSDMIPAFAGWLLDPDKDLLLIASGAAEAETAARHLARIGYDRVCGYLSPAMTGWAAQGRDFETTPAIDADAVAERVTKDDADWRLLDVRKVTEVAEGVVPGATPVFLGDLPDRLGDLDRNAHYTTMCASGARATIAASILQRAGFSKVDVFLGSMGAWRAAGREVVDLENGAAGEN